MRFIKANAVDFNCSTDTRYNRGQIGRQVNGKLYALRGFRANGDHVWIEVNDASIQPGSVLMSFRVLKARPAVTFNPHGIMTARAKSKRQMHGRPLAPLNYRMGVR